LAHWSEAQDKFPLSKVEKAFKKSVFDGAEVVYDYYRVRMGEEKELRAEQKEIKKLVKKYNLLTSGGSDVHAKEGVTDFYSTPWMAKQTQGLVEKMLKKKVFKGWSTI